MSNTNMNDAMDAVDYYMLHETINEVIEFIEFMKHAKIPKPKANANPNANPSPIKEEPKDKASPIKEEPKASPIKEEPKDKASPIKEEPKDKANPSPINEEPSPINEEPSPIKEEPKSKSKHTDDEMFKGVSMLDDKLLPCYKLNLSQALLEIKKNPKCVPFQIYLERWKYFNDKYKKANKLNEKPKPVVDDALLPPTQLTLLIAISKIKSNPLCVPFEAYMKRWNELKTMKKHSAMTK